MNDDTWAVLLIVACALILIACIAVLTWTGIQLHPEDPYQPRHAGEPGPDQDTHEPDELFPVGEEFARALTGEQPPDWWDQPAPAGRVEVLPGAATRIAATSQLTLSVLTRVRDALLPDAWRPPPAGVTFTPADPEVTCTDLPVVTSDATGHRAEHVDVIP